MADTLLVTAPGPGSPAWWDAFEDRQRRRRPRAQGLSAERIVAAALELVAAEGLEELTMRRLAGALDSRIASLYRHVASRDELLVLMTDQLLGEVVPPPPELGGRQRVEWIAYSFRRVLLGQAAMIPALTAFPIVGPNARRNMDLALGAFLAMGMPAEGAVAGCLACVEFVLGSVIFDTGRGTQGGSNGAALAQAAPAEALPSLWALRVVLAGTPIDNVFAAGLSALLDGLAASARGAGPGALDMRSAFA